MPPASCAPSTTRREAARRRARARRSSPTRSTATRPTSRARAQACAQLFGSGRGAGGGGRRVSRPASASRSLQLSVYADPAMAGAFDALRFSGPIGELIAETQERRHRRASSRRSPALTVLDVGTGTGRAALALAVRGARVTGVDCVGRDAARRGGAGRARPRSSCDFARRRARPCLRGSPLRRGHLPARADAHARLAAVAAELCRVADRRLVFDYPARSRAPRRGQAVTRAPAHALGARVEALPRVLRPCDSRRASCQRVSHRATSTGSSSCRSRCTSG